MGGDVGQGEARGREAVQIDGPARKGGEVGGDEMGPQRASAVAPDPVRVPQGRLCHL